MSFPGYRFYSRFLVLKGHRMHYLDEGPVHGEPVVMVHGNPTWSYFFRRLVSDLSARYRVVVPDHIGMGLSAVPTDAEYAYTLQTRIDDLDAFLEARGVRDGITLVVHDWGGAIGLGYALRHPERVRRLVVLNTAAFHLPGGKRFPDSLRRVRLPVLGPFLVRGLNAFCRVAAEQCVVTRLPSGVRDAYLAPYNNWRNRLAVLRFVEDIPLTPGDNAYQLLTEIAESLQRYRELPVLICWGMCDFVFDADILGEWIRRLPEAEVHRYEGAGHYVLEDAGPEVSRRVCAFLDTHPLAAAGGHAAMGADDGV